MIQISTSNTTCTPTSGVTTTYAIFDPQYRCISHNIHKHQEVIAWVRENVKGGFAISESHHGYIEGIRLQSEADYLLYLLKWE